MLKTKINVNTKVKIARLKFHAKRMALITLGIIIGSSWTFNIITFQPIIDELISPNVLVIENTQAVSWNSKPMQHYSEKIVSPEVANMVSVSSIPVNDPAPVGSQLNGRAKYQSIIREIAKRKSFNNIEGLLRLSHCESRFDTTAINVNKSGSKDRGLFQINDYWHPDVSDEQAFNPRFATEWTIDKISAGGINAWMCQWAYHDTSYDYSTK